ncbi:dehydrodolichyl diphosphate synthase subunit [Dermatophagoides farinae]|uniref:dehydrodolichyl diphosphate synthase subunit n=1 Tax=Dermatophagoides farinae TaxID=6954 RepID=UPI003F609127
MTTLFQKHERTWLERIVIRILKQGVIPKHIAFIMDGNRRFAEKLNIKKMIGHSKGFAKLTETLSWCRDLGITQATLYTFSIENFKRPKEEVDYLMDLFRIQTKKVIEEMSKIKQHETCIRIYGNIHLLPIDIQQNIARLVIETAKFDKFYLNICFAYTAREEINNAFIDLQQCVENHIIEPSDINHTTITNAMYSLGLNDPDILIRTSGEMRLSDFLLWQSSFSTIFFLDALWPEFTIWHLFAAIINHQYEYRSIKKSRENYFQLLQKEDDEFCRKIYHSHSSNYHYNNYEEFMAKRESKIKECNEFIRNKRIEHLYSILSAADMNSNSNNNNNHSNDKTTATTTTTTIKKLTNGNHHHNINGHVYEFNQSL